MLQTYGRKTLKTEGFQKNQFILWIIS